MATFRYPMLPKKRIPPYIRQKPEPRAYEAKTLTIAVGLSCNEGFVLCADRLMTHGKHTEFGAFSHYSPKVFPIEQIDFGAAICGSGDTLQLQAVANEISQKIIGLDKHGTDVRPILEETLNDLANRLGMAPELSLVLATVGTGTKPQFLRADGLVIQSANNIEILGLGETSAVRFMVDSAYDSKMSLRELTALGTAIVFVAKKYCPQYCGGETDVCVLPKDFLWNIIPLRKREIAEMEELFKSQSEQQLRNTLKDMAALT